MIPLKPEIIKLRGAVYIVKSSGLSKGPWGMTQVNSFELETESRTLADCFGLIIYNKKHFETQPVKPNQETSDLSKTKAVGLF